MRSGEGGAAGTAAPGDARGPRPVPFHPSRRARACRLRATPRTPAHPRAQAERADTAGGARARADAGFARWGGCVDERAEAQLLALGSAHSYAGEALLGWFVSWARSQPEAAALLVRRPLIAAAAERVGYPAGGARGAGTADLTELVQAL